MYIFSLKMATVQVVETSVTNNGLSKDYPHPDDNAKGKKRTTTNKLIPLGSNRLPNFNFNFVKKSV